MAAMLVPLSRSQTQVTSLAYDLIAARRLPGSKHQVCKQCPEAGKQEEEQGQLPISGRTQHFPEALQ